MMLTALTSSHDLAGAGFLKPALHVRSGDRCYVSYLSKLLIASTPVPAPGTLSV
jgi:hypothetical protein